MKFDSYKKRQMFIMGSVVWRNTLGQNNEKSSMNDHWNHVILQAQNVKKWLQMLNFNNFQDISTILFFKKAGLMAFMKIFPKNSTLIMDDFWPFNSCVWRYQLIICQLGIRHQKILSIIVFFSSQRSAQLISFMMAVTYEGWLFTMRSIYLLALVNSILM